MKTFHKFTLLFLFLSIFNATLSCSSNDKTLPQPIPDIEEEEEETKDVVLPEDIQIIPYGGKASEYQPGSSEPARFWILPQWAYFPAVITG